MVVINKLHFEANLNGQMAVKKSCRMELVD